MGVGEGDGAGVPDRDHRGGGQVAVGKNAMPPMWTVPLRPMVSSRSPVAPMGLCRCARRRAVVCC